MPTRRGKLRARARAPGGEKGAEARAQQERAGWGRGIEKEEWIQRVAGVTGVREADLVRSAGGRGTGQGPVFDDGRVGEGDRRGGRPGRRGGGPQAGWRAIRGASGGFSKRGPRVRGARRDSEPRTRRGRRGRRPSNSSSSEASGGSWCGGRRLRRRAEVTLRPRARAVATRSWRGERGSAEF